MMHVSDALIVGNSDGIGLELTRQLLAEGWRVTGVSRSSSGVCHENYTHHVVDVCCAQYGQLLLALLSGDDPEVCVYCAGTGELLDLERMETERPVIETNLLGAVTTAAVVIPRMVRAGRGHFIGLSSQADAVVSSVAPSYSASKAGLSSYLEGLALACKPRGVHVTNLRLGFVDTKLAKSKVRPFMVTSAVAAQRIVRCIARRPQRDTFPKRMAFVLCVIRAVSWMKRLFV